MDRIIKALNVFKKSALNQNTFGIEIKVNGKIYYTMVQKQVNQKYINEFITKLLSNINTNQ